MPHWRPKNASVLGLSCFLCVTGCDRSSSTGDAGSKVEAGPGDTDTKGRTKTNGQAGPTTKRDGEVVPPALEGWFELDSLPTDEELYVGLNFEEDLTEIRVDCMVDATDHEQGVENNFTYTTQTSVGAVHVNWKSDVSLSFSSMPIAVGATRTLQVTKEVKAEGGYTLNKLVTRKECSFRMSAGLHSLKELEGGTLPARPTRIELTDVEGNTHVFVSSDGPPSEDEVKETAMSKIRELAQN